MPHAPLESMEDVALEDLQANGTEAVAELVSANVAGVSVARSLSALAEHSERVQRRPARELKRRPRPEPVTLLIPAYNEETGLAQTIEQAREMFVSCGVDAEIVVVDDGSSDRTAEVARAGGARVVRHLYGRGYGLALRTGILEAKHEIIVICDADGTYPLDRVPDLLNMFHQGYDLVIGARTGRHFWGSLVKEVARRFFLRMCESATGTHIVDANSGLRVFRRSTILPHLPKMCTGFSFTTSQTLCFHLLSRPVGYMPIDYHERIGKTKVRHIRDSIRTAQYILQMFVIFNPIKLFTLLALWPVLLGMLVLGGQSVLAVAGYGGSWYGACILSFISFFFAGLLFCTGFAIYGISRQRWPDPVGGHGAV